MSDPILAPCRDNPAVVMRRREDGCIYCDGPRVWRTGLMPLSDMAVRDAERRYPAIKWHDGSWLDYGSGHGVEVALVGAGRSWDPATGEPEPEGHYDLVSLFHVIEHVDDPVALLRHVRERYTPGTIIVETPNANDWMLDQCEAYRNHWAWTDHRLVLTAEALLQAGRDAGLGEGDVTFVQRYSWSNAFRWMTQGKPGGHTESSWHAKYRQSLGDRTDTLWCQWVLP